MEDWAEVQRLFHREGLTRRAIARRLKMSRTTVIRLLALKEPPRYVRSRRPSLVDPFAAEIRAMLDLARARPEFLAAQAFQRTSYLAGEIVQLDWWHTGVQIPVGRGQTKEAFALVATLPHSGAHAVVFTLGRTVADFLPALVGCLERLGGVAEKAVTDNDSSIVAPGRAAGPGSIPRSPRSMARRACIVLGLQSDISVKLRSGRKLR